MDNLWTFLPLVIMMILLVLKTPVAYAMLFPTMLYFVFGQTMSQRYSLCPTKAP